ncbi:MAG: DUF2520 domain-containing protein [Acidobacteria bacterium]|nr:MAG: DUF2520 domain-containing protein [Acidobacteriota bacterium]
MLAKPNPLQRVVVVGRSRAGRAISRGLAEAGEAAVLLPGSATWDEEGRSAIRAATLLVVAVPDRFLAPVAERLAAALLGSAAPRPAALHLSGARDDSELHALAGVGCPTASCHPVQALDGSGSAPLAGVVYGIQGSPRGVEAARALAVALGGRPHDLGAADKPLWHLAAVLASGGVVGLLSAARDLLVLCGLTTAEALAALGPLARAALEGALERGPEAALTGPVARGDEATLAAHRRTLAERDPSRAALYEALVVEQERLARARRA